MREARRGWAEWLLGRVAGEDAARAVFGDLVEMSAGRGRVWFWGMWVRLGWRGPVALLVGFAVLGITSALFVEWRQRTPEVWRFTPAALNLVGPFLSSTAVVLWFVFPWAVTRYGRRDRFVQLTAVLTGCLTVTFLYVPWVSEVFGVLSLAVAGLAVLARRWQRPMLVLGAGVLAGYGGLLLAVLVRTGLTGKLDRVAVIRVFLVMVVMEQLLAAYAASRVREWLAVRE